MSGLAAGWLAAGLGTAPVLDLVPLRHDSGARYFHDRICSGIVPRPFCPNPAVLQAQPPDPAHSTAGGAVSWVSDSEIHIEFGPEILPDCLSTRRVLLLVQNEPGRGLGGDFLSNQAEVSFTNTRAGTPPPDQGNGLLAARQGDDVALEHTTGAAARFRFYRDPGKLTLAGTPLGAATAARTWLDRAVPSPAFYRVQGVECGTAEGP